MKRLLTTTALGMLLAASPAMAQTSGDSTSPAAPQTEQNQPDTGAPATSQPPASGTDSQSGSDAAKPDTAQSDTAAPLDQETLASNLIGTTVENTSGESIGEISDIVLAEDGSAKSVLVGVGGFLGLGAKNVAIDFSELHFRRDDRNNLSVTAAMSAEELQAMPAYNQASAAPQGQSGETSPMKNQEQAPGSGSQTSPDSGGANR